MKRAFVTGVGTSDLLGIEASESCNRKSRTEIPNLPRLWMNEAATPGQQRLQRLRDVRLPGAGLRDERTEHIAALEGRAAVEAADPDNRAR